MTTEIDRFREQFKDSEEQYDILENQAKTGHNCEHFVNPKTSYADFLGLADFL